MWFLVLLCQPMVLRRVIELEDHWFALAKVLGMQTLDRFLAEVQSKAVRIAQLSLRDHDDALDVVQDAMLRFAERYVAKPEAEWSAIFYRILYNRITDVQRARTRKRGLFTRLFEPAQNGTDDLDSHAYMADPAPTEPSRLSDEDRFAHVLDDALKALPERQRQAFLLREWEGLDVAGTAQVMGCGQGSVKTHLSRAKKSLQQALKDF